MITSHHNPKLKEIRRLLRRHDGGRFVAEGEDLLAAADSAGWTPLERYVAGENVEAEALAKVSALGSGTRALAVYEERWTERATGPLCVALWGVHDPGNVGTVLRSALAFGADSVAIGPDTADPYGPKAVRASMGAIFSVPLARVRAVDELPGERVALVARAGQPLRGRAAATIGPGSRPRSWQHASASPTSPSPRSPSTPPWPPQLRCTNSPASSTAVAPTRVLGWTS